MSLQGLSPPQDCELLLYIHGTMVHQELGVKWINEQHFFEHVTSSSLIEGPSLIRII